MIDLINLPDRLDDAILDQLAIIATSPMPEYVRTDRAHFDKCMRSLAILPRRPDDEIKGRLRVQLYWRKLEGFPMAALSWLVDRGIEEFDWFPNVKQCLELLRSWPDAERARTWRSIARRRVEREHEARYSDILYGIRFGKVTQDGVDPLPTEIKRRLVRDDMLVEEDCSTGETRYRIHRMACWALAPEE